MIAVLLLLLSAAASFASERVDSYSPDKELVSLWSPMLEVNASCPRFVFADTGHDGLGDQLERLFMGLSLSYKASLGKEGVSITIVVPDTFGKKSLHFSHGYQEVFHDILGIPHNITTMSQISKDKQMKRVSLTEENFSAYLSGKRSFADDVGCNTIVDVDVYDTCGGVWCPFRHSADMQRVLSPLLRKTRRLGGQCPKPNNKASPSSTAKAANTGTSSGSGSGTSSDSLVRGGIHQQSEGSGQRVLQVVWHVRPLALLETDRQQYSCKYCDAPGPYFRDVLHLLAEPLLRPSPRPSGQKQEQQQAVMAHTVFTRADHKKSERGTSHQHLPRDGSGSGSAEATEVEKELQRKYSQYLSLDATAVTAADVADKSSNSAPVSPPTAGPVSVSVTESLPHLVCSFLQADVLVSTGSSFPDLLSWFADRRIPVVLAEERAFNGFDKQPDKYKYRWAVSNSTEEGAFLLQGGHLVDDRAGSAREELGKALQALSLQGQG